MVILSSYLIWQIISFLFPPIECGYVYATLRGPAIDLQKMQKKIIFSNEADLWTSKIVAFGAQKTRTPTLKSRRPQNEALFDVDFGREA